MILPELLFAGYKTSGIICADARELCLSVSGNYGPNNCLFVHLYFCNFL